MRFFVVMPPSPTSLFDTATDALLRTELSPGMNSPRVICFSPKCASYASTLPGGHFTEKVPLKKVCKPPPTFLTQSKKK